MKALVALALAVVISFAANVWQWRDRAGKAAEIARLAGQISTISAAREADNAALALRQKKEREVQEYAAEQYAKIDKIEEAICLGLDDSALLDALRGLLSANPQCVRDAPADTARPAAQSDSTGSAGKK